MKQVNPTFPTNQEQIKDIAFEAVKTQTHSANEVKQGDSRQRIILHNSNLLANILQEEGIDYVD